MLRDGVELIRQAPFRARTLYPRETVAQRIRDRRGLGLARERRQRLGKSFCFLVPNVDSHALRKESILHCNVTIDLNPKKGREQKRVRPCLIVSTDAMNRSEFGIRRKEPSGILRQWSTRKSSSRSTIRFVCY